MLVNAEHVDVPSSGQHSGRHDLELSIRQGKHGGDVGGYLYLFPRFPHPRHPAGVGSLIPLGRGRVKRSLYARAVGYNYETTKIFMPAGREKPVYAPYVEHVPPDVTACIFG